MSMFYETHHLNLNENLPTSPYLINAISVMHKGYTAFQLAV